MEGWIMVEDCEKKRLWDRWLCRLGHALIDLGDNTYALKGQILAKDSVSGELVELEVVDGKLQIAPNVDVEVNLSENIGLLDSDENEINPATEDTLLLLTNLINEGALPVTVIEGLLSLVSSLEDRYNSVTSLISSEVVDSATPKFSAAWNVAMFGSKSLRIEALKNGIWDSGVDIEVQGAEEDTSSKYAPIYEIGTNGVINITDAINRIYSIPYHVNYIRLKITNQNTTPSSNYPTITINGMGQV
jgi:hypothetical protein